MALFSLSLRRLRNMFAWWMVVYGCMKVWKYGGWVVVQQRIILTRDWPAWPGGLLRAVHETLLLSGIRDY